MRGLHGAAVAACFLAQPAVVLAQPEPPPEPEPSQPTETPPATEDEETAEAEPAGGATEAPPSAPSEAAPAEPKATALPEPEPAPETEPAPILRAPQPGDQQPYPYLKEPAPEGFRRDVELGPTFGLWWRPAEGDGQVDYSPGFAYGAYARLQLIEWLGLRALVMATALPVSVARGALGPAPDTRVDQPDLQLILLGLRLEPTWVVTPRLRLWAGVGSGWASIEAPPPQAQDTLIVSARRTGVLIDLSAALGITFDILPSLMTVSLAVSGGLIANQSGDVFRPVQALPQDPPAQSISHYDGLPEFAGSVSTLASVGLVL